MKSSKENKAKDRARKRYSIFASFILCCLGTSLSVASLATQYWFSADCSFNRELSPKSSVHFGLFSGTTTLIDIALNTYNTKIVCSDGICMFSCGRTPELRRGHLKAVKNGDLGNFTVVEICDRVNAEVLSLSSEYGNRVASSYIAHHSSLIGNQEEGDHSDILNEAEEKEEDMGIDKNKLLGEGATSESPETTTHVVPDDPEFMNYGLWIGTISCLVIGMVFAVVGALFAVINTATTPVEFITGVPGLYIWNSMAALFNLLCVILWAVQFHQHLTKNVLLYDYDDGWSTEGLEVFGYSYWLVVVSIIVHIGNIVIIFVGTYERKVKEQVEKPDGKNGTILLY